MYKKLEEKKDKGIHMMQNIEKKEIVYPYYEEYLDPHQRGLSLPFEIRLWRNRSIVALILQTIASLTGFVMYSLRKMRIGQVVNVMCLLLIIFFARTGALTLQKLYISVHGVGQSISKQITSSVFGVIFLYSLLEIMFGAPEDPNQSSEKMMLFIFCLPYLADFLAGLCLFKLAFLLEEESNKQVMLQIPQISLNDEDLCVICSTNKIDTIMYTCGHKCACYSCSLEIKKKYKLECPVCRKEIKDLIRVYDCNK